MSGQQTTADPARRTVRMAPAAPRQRGGATTGAARAYASPRTLEFTGGGFIWR